MFPTPRVLGCALLLVSVSLARGGLFPQPVRPVLEYVVDNPDGTHTALFGYRNDNTASVTIPVGSGNRFSPAPEDRGQPSTFLTGRQVGLFTVVFGTGNQVWTLDGRTATASPNKRPVAALTSPASGLVLAAPGDLTLVATAHDPDANGSVSRVEFFQDGQKIGQDTSAPYEWAVTGLAAGVYRFSVRAVDNRNAPSLESEAVSVTVQGTPPGTGLPFSTGFEASEGYVLNFLDGQQGWTATGPAWVTDADYASGAWAAVVPGDDPPLILARSFDPHPDQPVVFVDFSTLPLAAESEPASIRFALGEAVRLAFVREGEGGVFTAFDGDGMGGGAWTPALDPIVLTPEGYAADWARVTLRADYQARKWDLYVGGVMTAANLGFVQDAPTSLGTFSLSGHQVAPTLLDAFSATFANPLFADADKDGMDDAWETAHGLNPALDDRDQDPDGDGQSNVIEFLLGSHPNLADADGDGLRDPWEMLHFGSLAAVGSDDADGDGLTNAQEFAAGTNPVDFYNGRAFVLGTVAAGASTVAYQYDNSGRLVAAVYSDGRSVQFAHDTASNLAAVSSTGGADGGTTIVDWRLAHDLPADGSGIGADDAILAGDGLPNLAKYAFGFAPHVAVASDQPSVRVLQVNGSSHLALTYQRPHPSPSDLRYTVQVSPDGQAWTSAPGTTAEVDTSFQGGIATVRVRDTAPVGGAQLGRRIRLLIERRVQP